MLTSSLASLLSFLGPIGGPELIILLIIGFLLFIPVAIIICVALYFNRKSSPPTPSPIPSTVEPSIQARLEELESLKSRNLISESEYEEKRKEILSGL